MWSLLTSGSSRSTSKVSQGRRIHLIAYAKVQAFSIETAGVFDLDAELEIWFSGLGKVRLGFSGKYDVVGLSRTIASFVL